MGNCVPSQFLHYSGCLTAFQECSEQCDSHLARVRSLVPSSGEIFFG